jgi:hypothetical protein
MAFLLTDPNTLKPIHENYLEAKSMLTLDSRNFLCYGRNKVAKVIALQQAYCFAILYATAGEAKMEEYQWEPI